ncbi:hypothetical protein SCMU_21550 [Sinomonas cyclohexanicum]|uniref:Helix-hairpin-helix DNA-binding motif class 1 domain-containing protein n=1 Tax=Sinomonas cyclohexanicum TaxID=322009 RepID=A0ABM7PVT4_SINCY|nr:helix-hairpin-helix domain-containing protein [Corynebacterium cyclohexanicum]BCT76313.1 hypothetical protein SCMU_21550 [Corynebacterium cyclohexanicum]
MVFSRGFARARRQEARHRWDALFPASQGSEEPLLDLAGPVDTEPLRVVADAGGPRDSPPRNAGPRLGLSPRLGAVVAGLLAVSCVVWWAFSGAAQPDVRPVTDVGTAPTPAVHSSGTPEDRDTDSAPTAAGPTVHVAGAVAVPGIYHLAPGARVYEAIAAAGGAAPGADVDRLNLAASVDDGTRLRVPFRDEPQGSDTDSYAGSGAAAPSETPGSSRQTAGGSATPAGAGTRVNINTATVQELGTLPRVGPVLAQRIVDYRAAHGRFSAPEDLDAVSGIGPKMLESLLPLVTVG